MNKDSNTAEQALVMSRPLYWLKNCLAGGAMVAGKVGPVFALLLVIVFFGALEPDKFLSFHNFGNVAGQTAVIAIAAVGMTFIIISAGIDLSVGSLVALAGVYATMMISSKHSFLVPWLEGAPGGEFLLICAGIATALFTGALCGAINGYTITLGKLPPFIVTLGMMSILRGVALESAKGMPVTNLPDSFRIVGNAVMAIPYAAWLASACSSIGLTGAAEYFSSISFANANIYIPYSIFILIPVALAGGFLLKYTVFGVQVYAVGSNEQTARLCGVNVERVKLMVYLFGGLTTGLAGFIYASRLNTGQPSEGVGMELEVIAAVVIGGASLMGGEGTILGSIVGAFIIIFLRNGCNLIGLSSFVQQIVIGAIIITAVFIDQIRRRAGSK